MTTCFFAVGVCVTTVAGADLSTGAAAEALGDFVEAIKFVNRVADVAEREGHHPDIAIHWNKVELVLWTHKIGGLHENDFILAAKVNRLLEEDPDTSMAG